MAIVVVVVGGGFSCEALVASHATFQNVVVVGVSGLIGRVERICYEFWKWAGDIHWRDVLPLSCPFTVQTLYPITQGPFFVFCFTS